MWPIIRVWVNFVRPASLSANWRMSALIPLVDLVTSWLPLPVYTCWKRNHFEDHIFKQSNPIQDSFLQTKVKNAPLHFAIFIGIFIFKSWKGMQQKVGCCNELLVNLWSISPTFYRCIWANNLVQKKFQAKNVSTKKLCVKLV